MVDLTPDDVARLRLVSQRLAGPPAPGPVEAVRHLLAVQGQDLPGVHVAVASRTRDRSTAAVRAAFDDGTLVRTWPMRGTLHVLAADDAAWVVRLLGPRAFGAAAKRWAEVGLDDAAFARALDVAEDRLADGPASRDALGQAWTDAGFEPGPATTYRLLNGLATTGHLVLGPVAPPRPGSRATDQLVALAGTWLPAGSRRDDVPDDELLAELAARYAAGHGPVGVPDLVRWTYQTVGTMRRAVAAARERGLVVPVTCEGRELFGGPGLAELVADLPAVHRATDGVRLLAAFDEVVLGYADRTATVAAEHEQLVVPGGNGMFRPVVVDGGRAVATWKRGGPRRDRLMVEPFDEAASAEVLGEAAAAAFAGLPTPP